MGDADVRRDLNWKCGLIEPVASRSATFQSVKMGNYGQIVRLANLHCLFRTFWGNVAWAVVQCDLSTVSDMLWPSWYAWPFYAYDQVFC